MLPTTPRHRGSRLRAACRRPAGLAGVTMLHIMWKHALVHESGRDGLQRECSERVLSWHRLSKLPKVRDFERFRVGEADGSAVVALFVYTFLDTSHNLSSPADLSFPPDNLRFNMGVCLWGDRGNHEIDDNPCKTR